MSILDLHADEQVQASLNTAPAPVAPPAKFSAWSAIPRAIGVAAGEVGASAADLVNAARVFRDTPSREIAASGLPISAYSSELGDTVRKYLDDFRPDPNTATTAEQVLFGFSRGLAKVVPATIAAGPVGAIVAGIEEGMTVSDELRRKGVGADARTKAGMIQGAGLASAALPLLGTTLAETAALYVAGGPGGFMAQQAITRQILRDAGHDQIAAGYDPFDPVGLAVASLIPAGFTAYGLRGQVKAARAKAAADFNAGPVPSEPTPVAAAVADAYKPAPPRIPPEVVDAAMVQNLRDAETRIVRSLPPSDSLALPPAPTADEVGRFGKVESVPLAMARATQSRMEWARFDAGDYAPPLVEGFSDIPLAVRKLDGEVLVFDGHHRTADAINRGETEMPMRVLEAKDYAPEFAGRKPAPSTISDDELMAELSAPPKPAAEAGDPIAKLNEPADAKPKPAADPIMSTVATRVADLETTAPDMVVRIAEDGKAITLADDLAEVRRMVAEGTDDSLGTLDADLIRVAVECALSTGG